MESIEYHAPPQPCMLPVMLMSFTELFTVSMSQVLASHAQSLGICCDMGLLLSTCKGMKIHCLPCIRDILMWLLCEARASWECKVKGSTPSRVGKRGPSSQEIGSWVVWDCSMLSCKESGEEADLQDPLGFLWDHVSGFLHTMFCPCCGGLN